MNTKSFPDLGIYDLLKNPVWRFTNRSTKDELEIEPLVVSEPADLEGAIIGAIVTLADGSKVWALIQNIAPLRPDLNEHFLTLTIAKGDDWFSLARYHDVTADTNGPEVLAAYLERSLAEVFPITFDVTQLVGLEAPGLAGKVNSDPSKRLKRAEVIALAIQVSKGQ